MFVLEPAPLDGVDLDAEVLSITARDVAAWDASRASDDELLRRAVALEQVRRLLDAGSCHVLAELDRRGTTDERAGLRTAHVAGA